jgi:hypothetical protein
MQKSAEIMDKIVFFIRLNIIDFYICYKFRSWYRQKEINNGEWLNWHGESQMRRSESERRVLIPDACRFRDDPKVNAVAGIENRQFLFERFA